MEIDPNVVAAGAATELTKSFFASLKKGSIDFFSRQYSYLFEDFSRYLGLTFNRCNHVRTIINKEVSFEIANIYVPGKFRLGDEFHSDEAIVQTVRDSIPSVVLGFGGIGKTVFAKHLWMSIFKEPFGKIPIYLELRKLNSITDIDIETYVRRTISPKRSGIDADIFHKFLDDGRFVFIFDGFDEISADKKDKVSQDIINLSYEYPGNGYFISSRHDDRFYSWQRFRVYKACSFDKEQVLDLLEKIPYDRDTKRKFVADIIQKKYKTYDTFLSTPLLTLMMLMTFSQFAEVPDKRHIFYRYAFMTLYSWHDSSKESFNREKQTGLVLDQFEKAFSIFCLISYLNGDVEFDENTIRSYVNQVKKYLEFDFDTDRFLIEMMDTVNLIYRDGDAFLFTHRSFQEYFTAYAVVNYFQPKMKDIIPRLFRTSDIVLGLMYEINRVVVDENYVIPTYDLLKPSIDSVLKARNSADVFRSLQYTYIAVYQTTPKHDLFPRIFGAEIQNKAWSFICTLRALFENEPSIVSFSKTSRSHHTRLQYFDEIAREILRSDKMSDLIICYSPLSEELRYETASDYDYDTLGEDILKTLSEGKTKIIDNRKAVRYCVEDSTFAKSLFVACDLVVRKARSLQKQKDRSIDDILL